MEKAGRVPACLFVCYSLVRVGAGGRRGSCCACKGAQTREAGEKGGGCEFDSGVLLSHELGEGGDEGGVQAPTGTGNRGKGNAKVFGPSTRVSGLDRKSTRLNSSHVD